MEERKTCGLGKEMEKIKKVITYQSVKYVIVFLILWKRKPASKKFN